MDKNIARLFEIYKLILLAHIETKTVFSQFHEKSQEFYETLFEVFHTISEKRQDLGIDDPADEETIAQETCDNIDEAKKIVCDMIKGKNTVGMDNLLRGLVDKLEGICGDAKAFVNEENDEENETKDTKSSVLPIKK